MILYDFSSLMHRAVFTAVKNVNPHKKDGKFITMEFIGLAIHRILNEILEVQSEYSKKYGNIVICFDDHSRKYWRKNIYPAYKSQRKAQREESEINYTEVFKHLEILSRVIDEYTPWKSFHVPELEADDLIAVLAKRFALYEPILIHSPDKDMVQLHKYGNIIQYSGVTNKFVTESDKGPDWELEHVCLGDASDGVPKITDNTVFSKNFKEFLKTKNISITELEYDNLTDYTSFLDYNIYKKNRKGEETELDIFENQRFGIATLKKKIQEYGSLDNFLDTNPLYRKNYERNKILVLAENIPAKYETDVIVRYNQSKADFNIKEIEKYLLRYNLNTLINDFRDLYNLNSKVIELTAENCGF